MKIIEARGIFTYNVTAISYLATFYIKQSRIKTTVEGRLLRKTTSHICFKIITEHLICITFLFVSSIMFLACCSSNENTV